VLTVVAALLGRSLLLYDSRRPEADAGRASEVRR